MGLPCNNKNYKLWYSFISSKFLGLYLCKPFFKHITNNIQVAKTPWYLCCKSHHWKAHFVLYQNIFFSGSCIQSIWAFMPWLNTSLLIYKRGQQYKPYKTGDLQVSLVNIRSFTFKMLNQMIVFSYFQCREGRWGMFFISFTLKSFFSHNTHLSFALVWPLSWKNLVTPLDRENFISWKDGRNYKIE